MRIKLELFKETAAPHLHKSGLHAIGRAHLIMSKSYCDKMTMRSLCPLDCSKCTPMLALSAQMQDADNPYAIFTFRMKNEFARRAEAATKDRKVTQPRNALGEAVEVDVMDQLLEAFS